ncbi:MAG: hypothetical protein ACT6RD_06980 [Brevundimonas sp.]|uniref:hypothetical protein n=1 Tax=Brevundimonas sp. TaxID=1871086 RepID=UPI004033834B
MRRFLIWSGLAALIGLALAVAGVWAYTHFYARFQPVAIDRNQAEIQRLLDSAPWISAGGGDQPVYVVGYRENGPTLDYLRQEAAKLHVAGGDVRVILFARPDRAGVSRSTPAERATIAELWWSRDWTLYQRWIAAPARDWTAEGVAPADGNLARSAIVDASRRFAERLSDLLKEAGVSTDWPLVIWRDREGFLKACACSDRRSWAFIRDDLGAPDALGADTPFDALPEADATAAPIPPATEDRALPYPDLPAIPPSTAPQAQPQIQSPAQPGAAAPRTAGPPPSTRLERQTTRPPASRSTTPRSTAPKPPEEEDTRFY